MRMLHKVTRRMHFLKFCLFLLLIPSFDCTEWKVDNHRRFCGHGRYRKCCRGWYNAIGAPCSIPSCAGNCGDRGRCVEPDTCLCADGVQRFDCEQAHEESMQADQAVGSCSENCRNRGLCVSNKCQCNPGFTGERCEVPIESSCFAKLHRGLCVNPVHRLTSAGNVTTLMSRETCCNTFGIAWGEPCQPCRVGLCGQGYHDVHGTCRDINECQLPGVCRGGRCTNLDGTYSCECPSGYQYDKENLECMVSIDPCLRNEHRCLSGGKCVTGANGEFQCLCNAQYVVAKDRKSCVLKKTLTFDFCSVYKGSICQNGICIPRDNSYECICNPGFEPTVDRKSCRHRIDICAIHRGYLCQNGQCISVGRDFYCNCNPGFVPSFDRRKCQSRCEQLGAAACPNGRCVAEPNGDYHCQCFPGFHMSIDGKRCVEVEQPLVYQPGIPEKRSAEYLPNFLYRQADQRRPSSFAELDYQRDFGYQKEIPKRSQAFTRWSKKRSKKSKVPPCERAEVIANCAGGFCLNLGGSSYQCECLNGYTGSEDGRKCTKVNDPTRVVRK